MDIELTENEYSLQGHSIPLDSRTTSGWGRVELPGDSNPKDNLYCFVFAEPPERRTVIVAVDPKAAEPLRLATQAPIDPAFRYAFDVLPPNRAGEIDWDATALVLWQAPLPDGLIARQLENFVDAGKTVMFFPADQTSDNELFGAKWGSWQTSAANAANYAVDWWRDDADLLGGTRSGDALPLDDLKTYRYCSLQSDANLLARFKGGDALLSRAATDHGAAYFCSTLPHATHSSLARDGVAFYVMLQRALAQGAAMLGTARQVTGGVDALSDDVTWQTMDETQTDLLVSERGLQSATYQADDRLLAINRPASEDMAPALAFDRLDELLSGLDFQRIDDEVDNPTSLASEIWRTFLVLMTLALIGEAALCLQPKKSASRVSGPTAPMGSPA